MQPFLTNPRFKQRLIGDSADNGKMNNENRRMRAVPFEIFRNS
jgi:hypothetical protein